MSLHINRTLAELVFLIEPPDMVFKKGDCTDCGTGLYINPYPSLTVQQNVRIVEQW